MANLLLLGLGVDTLDGGYVQRRGQERDDRVEQLLHTLVVERRTAEHGHERHVDRSLADCGDKLVGGDRIGVLEELLHQGLVRSGNLLDELRTPLGGLGLHVVGDLLQHEVVADGLVVEVVDRIIIYKVYQALELVLRTDGQHYRQRRSAEVLLDLGAYRQEVGARTVHLVHVADTGYVVFVGLTPYRLRLGLDTAHSAERGNGAVKYAQRTLHLDREVDVSRSIDQVDLILLVLIVPECGGCSRRDGDTTLLLLNHPVHRGAALVNLTDLVGLTRVEEDTLRGGRLTGIDVRHDTDVTSIVKISCHLTLPLLESEMRECLVRLSHAVHLLLTLVGGTLLIVGIDYLCCEFLGHRLTGALA